jgi:hypothetical protein
MEKEYQVIHSEKTVKQNADPNSTLEELLNKVGVDPKKEIFKVKEGSKIIYSRSRFNFNERDLKKKLSDLNENEINFQSKMTRMFFSTSGKSGFEFFEGNQNLKGKKYDREILIKMYQRENELRLTEEIQEEMDKCQMFDDDAYARLLDNLQRKVLKGKFKIYIFFVLLIQ